MTPNPDFSVFELLHPSNKGSILLSDPRMLLHVSRKVEERLLRSEVKGDLYVGFQKASMFLKREATYRVLASQLHRLYIFAYPDVTFPSIKNIVFIPLKAQDKLCHEWFLVFHSLSYFTALAGTEKPNQPFEAIWTFDLPNVKLIAERLSRAIDATAPFFPENAYDQNAQNQMLQLHIKDLVTTEEKPTIER